MEKVALDNCGCYWESKPEISRDKVNDFIIYTYPVHLGDIKVAEISFTIDDVGQEAETVDSSEIFEGCIDLEWETDQLRYDIRNSRLPDGPIEALYKFIDGE